MGIHPFRSFSISLILSLSSLHFVLVLLLPYLSPRSFFLSILACLIFYHIFLSGVQSTCTANPEQVSPSPLSDYLQLHLTTYPPASSCSASANCLSVQLLIQFVSPNGSPGHPNHFTNRTSTPILSWMTCIVSAYDSHAICFFFSLILLSSPIPLTLSRCSQLLCQFLAFAPISFILPHCL